MNYSENDLPVDIHHGEVVTLEDGTTVRFESNGEAKDVFLAEDFAPSVQLFPGMEHTFTTSKGTYKLTALFEDNLKVEKA